MENNTSIISCAAAKEMDIVNFLAELGYYPKKIVRNDYWYLSPLRQEKNASFKINRHKNVWYDHGIGKGGTLIDLGLLLYECTLPELLKNLSGVQPTTPVQWIGKGSSTKDNDPIKIVQVQPIQSPALQHYLFGRKIPLTVASQYCVEAHYEWKEKSYFALGFLNDSGGYELRNAIWKNSSAPKDITTIKNGASTIAVFEGFFDFLSYLTLSENNTELVTDYCILNSLSFFGKSQSFLEQYTSIHLFLNNDKAGQYCSQQALQKSKRYQDHSASYAPCKDLNEFLVRQMKLRRGKKLNL